MEELAPTVVAAATAHAEALEKQRQEQFKTVLQEAIAHSDKSTQALDDALAQHFKDDLAFQASTLERFDSLATKEDTKEIMNAIKTVHLGFGVVKIGWKSFLMVGAVVGALIAIVTFGKFLILGLAAVISK